MDFMSSGISNIDVKGIVEAVSHTTGSTAEVEFTPRKGNQPSQLNGQCFNSDKKMTHKLEGYWQEEIRLVDEA